MNENREFQKGDRVVHKTFGSATVIRRTYPKDDKRYADITDEFLHIKPDTIPKGFEDILLVDEHACKLLKEDVNV